MDIFQVIFDLKFQVILVSNTKKVTLHADE